MTVPAHVHLDEHPCDIGDNDNYELEVSGAGNGMFNCNEQVSYPGMYTSFTANSAYYSGPFINPYTYDPSNPLRFLFYYAAQISDHFASQDWSGDNDLYNSPYEGMSDYTVLSAQLILRVKLIQMRMLLF